MSSTEAGHRKALVIVPAKYLHCLAVSVILACAMAISHMWCFHVLSCASCV